MTLGGGFGPLGVTALLGVESGPLPLEFVANTTKTYVVPLVRPLTVVDVAGAGTVAASVHDAGGDVGHFFTPYDVIDAPPSLLGAVHETVADALPAVAVTPVGAPGTSAPGVTAFVVAPGPVPTELVALIVNV